jgi:outer membrane protein OmpA-like peptidoglycan-associated protein
VRSIPILTATLLSLSLPARAQVEEHPRFPAERLQLASDRNGLVDIEWPEPIARGALETYGWAGWARDPLVVRELSTGRRIGELVRDRTGGEVGASWAPLRPLQLSVAVPFIASQGRPTTQPRVATVDLPALARSGAGDVRVAAKVALLSQEQRGISLAFIPALSFPSGGSSAYRGEGGPAFLPKVALGWKHENGLRVAANLGAVVRRTERVIDQTAGSEITFGAGAGYRFLRLDLAAALSGAVSASRPFARANENALEARSTVTVRLARHLDVLGGGGLGLLIGWGTPSWRLFGGVRVPFGGGSDAAPAAPGQPVPPTIAGSPATPTPEAEVQAAPPAPELVPPTEAEPVPPPPAEEPVPAAPPPQPVAAPPPDAAPGPAPAPLAQIGKDRIEVLGKIRFATDSDVIVKASLPVLDGVATLLRGHREVERLRIEGHTDDRGAAGHNLDLSRRRAAAAVRYLVQAGIDPARLESAGLGSSRPVASNATAAGRARNRRLEFVIVAGESVP